MLLAPGYHRAGASPLPLSLGLQSWPWGENLAGFSRVTLSTFCVWGTGAKELGLRRQCRAPVLLSGHLVPGAGRRPEVLA